MKNYLLPFVGLLFFSATTLAIEQAAPQHSAEVHHRMQLSVPYAVDETLQTFTKTVHGGVQHVVTKSPDNIKQIKLVQAHLAKLAEQFRKGDFSATERVHGPDMPGLALLKTAQPDDIKIEYKPLDNGGQIHYSTEYVPFIQAIHVWFDAQIGEHGNDQIPGHNQHHKTMGE